MPIEQPDSDADLIKRASRLRFANIVFGSIGGAILFGLVSSAAVPLFQAAATGAVLPIVGIVGIAALSLTCVYLGANFLYKALLLDQENQARKINEFDQGKTTPAPTIETGRTPLIPGTTTDRAAENQTAEQPAKQWAASVAPNQASDRTEQWQSRVAPTTANSAAVTLH